MHLSTKSFQDSANSASLMIITKAPVKVAVVVPVEVAAVAVPEKVAA